MAIDFGRDLIIRWPDAQAAHVRLLQQIGIQAVLTRPPVDPAFEKACQAAGIQTMPESDLKTVRVEELTPNPGPYAALAHGLWPGIRRTGAGNNPNDETASASGEPWVDANGFWIAWLHALYPQSAPVLAYQANKEAGLEADRAVPFDTLTLALAEARSMGGNYILSVEPAFREALLKDDPRAVADWKQLGVTAKWLADNRALFAVPPMSGITELVEAGDETAEFANLLYRRNGSPRLTAVPPAPSKEILALVTTGMKAPKPATAARILEHARLGATVVVDDPAQPAWWKVPGMKQVKAQSDRVFYSLGKGTVVAYNERVSDPSEHALDMIDIVTHPKRAVRIWNAPSVIAVAAQNGPGKAVVRYLNYGGSGGRGRRGGGGGFGPEIQSRVQGTYRTATLLRPGEAPMQLETFKRGTTTEVFFSGVSRVAVVRFE
jgi:hypothetical protein